MLNSIRSLSFVEKSAVAVFAVLLAVFIANYSEPLTSVANASQPTLMGAYDTVGNVNPKDIFVTNEVSPYGNTASSTAYIVTAANSGASPEFYIVDTSNPITPELLGSLNIGSTVNGVYVEGNYAYLATESNSQELVVVDISDKSSPVVAGSFDTDEGKDATAIFVRNSIVYLGTVRNDGSGDREFYALDASDPSNIIQLGSQEINFRVRDIYVDGAYAYVANNNNSKELVVLDISNPSAIYEAGFYDAAGSADAYGVYYDSGKVYLARANGMAKPDFLILDAQDPSNISLLGALDLSSNNTGVAAYGDTAFVSSDKSGREMMVIDVSDPSAPQLLSNFNAFGEGVRAALGGEYAYLASKNNSKEMQVVNVGFPVRSNLADIDGDGMITIACLGDSNTQPWWGGPTWCEQLDAHIAQFSGWKTINLGINGATAVLNRSIDANSQFDNMVTNYFADAVIFPFGTNDLYSPLRGITPEEVLIAYQNLKSRADAENIQSFVALTPPVFNQDGTLGEANVRIDQLNDLIRATFLESGVIDFSSSMVFPDDYQDRIHMNESGHEKRAGAAYQKLVGN